MVMNSNRQLSQRKKGKYILEQFKNLKTKFGLALAKSLRDDKKKLEEAKQPGDSTVYFMKHPDFPNVEAGHMRAKTCEAKTLIILHVHNSVLHNICTFCTQVHMHI